MTTTPSSPSAEIGRLLEEQRASGLSIAEFARQRGVGAHRLYWARRREERQAEREEPRTAFRELLVRDRSLGSPDRLEVRLPSGLSIYLTRDFDDVALRRLLGVLAPC